MQVIEHIVNYEKTSDTFRLHYISDIHEGNSGHDRNALRRDVNMIKDDPNAIWFGGGDYADCIVTSDSKRWDPKAIAPEYFPHLDNLVTKQFETVKRELLPIKDKCVGLHDGNHEASIRRKYHVDHVNAWAAEWGVPHLKNLALTRLTFRRKDHSSTFIVFSSHSSIAGRNTGGKINRLTNLMSSFDADIYMVGHGHHKVHAQPVILGCTRKGEPKLQSQTRVAFMTGAYLRTYQEDVETYGETSLYSPTELGALRVCIKPESRELWIEG
jgi:hypothetical protein